MSGETIPIITEGFTLAGLNLTSFRAQRSEIAEFRAEISGFRTAIAAPASAWPTPRGSGRPSADGSAQEALDGGPRGPAPSPRDAALGASEERGDRQSSSPRGGGQ